MSDYNNVQLAEPAEIRFIESEFTVEKKEGCGGDFERNLGGNMANTRITFKGYITPTMYETLADAITKVVER